MHNTHLLLNTNAYGSKFIEQVYYSSHFSKTIVHATSHNIDNSLVEGKNGSTIYNK